MTSRQEPVPPISQLPVHCVSAADQPRTEQRDIVIEAPITIEIKDTGSYTIMCTPHEQVAMAVGFAFSEGLIRSRNDIAMVLACPDDPNVIRMQLTSPPGSEAPKRNLLIVSSCGICGSEDMPAVLASLGVSGNTLTVTAQQLTDWITELHARQQLFKTTGATHAVGMVCDGRLVAVCEDLGRHTAFDKALGTCLLKGLPTAGAVALSSGRVSFEIVAKAARTGVELIAAVSAPSSLAVEAADRCNITLCGFVRGRDATVYSHPERITK